MGKMKYAKSPLLYIQQPAINTPEAPMQHNYTSSRKKTKETESQPVQQEKPIKARPTRVPDFTKSEPKQSVETDNDMKQITDEQADPEEEEQESKRNLSGDRPKFKDMTIREKVDYFVSIPPHIPKMRCEIKTEEKNYRGMIVDFNDNDEVFMQVGRRSSTTMIKIDAITDIRLLGF